MLLMNMLPCYHVTNIHSYHGTHPLREMRMGLSLSGGEGAWRGSWESRPTSVPIGPTHQAVKSGTRIWERKSGMRIREGISGMRIGGEKEKGPSGGESTEPRPPLLEVSTWEVG